MNVDFSFKLTGWSHEPYYPSECERQEQDKKAQLTPEFCLGIVLCESQRKCEDLTCPYDSPSKKSQILCNNENNSVLKLYYRSGLSKLDFLVHTFIGVQSTY